MRDVQTYGTAWERLGCGSGKKGRSIHLGALSKWRWCQWWEVGKWLGEARDVIGASQGAPGSSFSYWGHTGPVKSL